MNLMIDTTELFAGIIGANLDSQAPIIPLGMDFLSLLTTEMDEANLTDDAADEESVPPGTVIIAPFAIAISETPITNGETNIIVPEAKLIPAIAQAEEVETAEVVRPAIAQAETIEIKKPIVTQAETAETIEVEEPVIAQTESVETDEVEKPVVAQAEATEPAKVAKPDFRQDEVVRPEPILEKVEFPTEISVETTSIDTTSAVSTIPASNIPISNDQAPAYEQIAKEIEFHAIKDPNFNAGSQVKEFSMDLYPKELGKISVKFKLDQNKLTIDIASVKPETHRLLTGQVDKLIANLGLKDVIVENVQISQAIEDYGDQLNSETSQEQKQWQKKGKKHSTGKNQVFVDYIGAQVESNVTASIKTNFQKMDYII